MVKIIVTAGGTVPTQQYGNYQPSYTLEEELDSKDPAVIEKRTRELRAIAEKLYQDRDGRFRELVNAVAKQNQQPQTEEELVEKLLSVRWYEKDGKKYPSVTSIISPFGIELSPDMIERGWTQDDIMVYADRGTIVHDQVEHFLTTGEWLDMTKHKLFKKVTEYRSPVITDEKPITPLDCNFKGFMEKYWTDFVVESVEEEVYSEQHLFAGRYDIGGAHQGKKAIIDVKTASGYQQDKKDKYFMQCAAYDIATGSKCERYVIIPLKPNTKQGFGAPIITEDVEKYRKMFLEKRKEFDVLLEQYATK